MNPVWTAIVILIVFGIVVVAGAMITERFIPPQILRLRTWVMGIAVILTLMGILLVALR